MRIDLRRLVALACTGVLGLLVMAVGAGPAAAAECGNEAIRKQQGATYLPDCRAYELVSPEGARPKIAISATEGGAVRWTSHFPPSGPAGDAGGQVYLSRRVGPTAQFPNGWSTVGVIPPQSQRPVGSTQCPPSMYFSPSLSTGVLSAGEASISLAGDGTEKCQNHNEPALLEAAGTPIAEPEGAQNLFVTQLGAAGTGYWQLVNRTPGSAVPANAWLLDASTAPGEELSHVLFAEKAQLTAEAPAGENLYEWAGGRVHLVTYLPDGTPAVGTLANDFERYESEGTESGELLGAAAFTNAMSGDGSRVFFTTAEDKLYVRLHATAEPLPGAVTPAECVAGAKACTIQVDASQAGGAGGGATFLTANRSGSEVFFIDEPAAELTADTEPGSGPNLYEYEVDTGKLVDLTGGKAEAKVLGYSGFGERAGGAYHLYFAAEGALAAGATPGQPNLYALGDEGGTAAVTFVATLNAGEDGHDWGTSEKIIGSHLRTIERIFTRASPNGGYLTFMEGARLFRYDAATSEAVCVSCTANAPSGTILAGNAKPIQRQNRGGPAYMSRMVLDSGQVFFTSPDALVGTDSNGIDDVYEYAGGAVHLISSGLGTDPARFEDASADGRDVFFRTAARLIPADSGGEVLYDARRGGGFAEPAAASGCEEPSGCRPGTGSGPALLSPPASVGFTGLGNIEPPAGKASPTQGKNQSGGKAGRKAKAKRRRRKLRKALKVCKRRYRHNRHERRKCKRHARKRYGAKAKGARHHGHGHHRRRHHRRNHHHHRAHRHHHGGGR